MHPLINKESHELFLLARISCITSISAITENELPQYDIKKVVLITADETYFWTAGRRVRDGDQEIWDWQGTLYTVGFTKWFPGKFTYSIMKVILQCTMHRTWNLRENLPKSAQIQKIVM